MKNLITKTTTCEFVYNVTSSSLVEAHRFNVKSLGSRIYINIVHFVNNEEFYSHILQICIFLYFRCSHLNRNVILPIIIRYKVSSLALSCYTS